MAAICAVAEGRAQEQASQPPIEVLPAPPLDIEPPRSNTLSCNGANLAQPSIRIDVQETKSPHVDRTLNARQLTYVARQLGSEHSSRGRVLGLTKVRFSYRVGPLTFGAAMDGSTLCLHPTDINVQLQAIQEVMIVRTSQSDSCWDRGILEHEMQHVSYNNAAVEQAAALLSERLKNLSAIMHGDDMQAVAEEMAGLLSQLVARTLSETVEAARARHGVLDAASNRNGDRLRARCVR